MVTWGTDSVRHFNTTSTAQAPSTSFSFSQPPAAPTTATGFSGAQSSGGLFGAPSSFGALGASPTPAPAFGFGTNAPPAAAVGGMFGSPVAGGSIFGAPFAAATPALPQQPQTPAHAALQAHIDASARAEEARVLQRMQKIHNAYTSGGEVSSDEPSHCFSTTLYNPVTQQERQFQAAYLTAHVVHGIDTHQKQLFVPPKPPQINEADWNSACIRNPDSFNFMPVVAVGADSLKSRVILHQSQADAVVKQVSNLTEVVAELNQRRIKVQRELATMKKTHEHQRVRLLKALKHVEVARCFNIPQQPAELEAHKQMVHLSQQIVEDQLVPSISRIVKQPSNASTLLTSTIQAALAQPDGSLPSAEQEEEWKRAMTHHRSSIAQMTKTLQADLHDLKLIQERVTATAVLQKLPTR